MLKLKEFPNRECGPDTYNSIWFRNPKYTTHEGLYVQDIVNLLKKFHPNPQHILDVGAGFGIPAAKIIHQLQPQAYTLYEFSDAADYILKFLKPFGDALSCSIKAYKQSFRDIENLERFDCIVALEILEHINWDLKFLEKIKSGTLVFLSVPKKHGLYHVRAFPNARHVVGRYSKLLDIKEIVIIGKWYCVAAKRR